MADDLLALADVLLINDSNNADISVSDVLNKAPFLSQLTTVEATNGDLHKYLKYTQAPVVGYRAVNDGRDFDSSVSTQEVITLKILDASFAIDKAQADSSNLGPEGLIRREATYHLQQAFFKAEVQALMDSDANGPDGLAAVLGAHSLSHAAMVYDVDTANTATGNVHTSVFFVRTALNGVAFVLGNGTSIDIGESMVQDMVGANGHFPVYYTPISIYTGLQLGSLYDSARIVNVSTGSDGVKLTDDHLYRALKLFEVSMQPTHCVMNRAALEQLRDSRTATNVTGAPAPRPTEIEGIPIVVVDSIPSNLAFIDTTP